MSCASSIIRRIDETLRRLESARHRHVQGYGLIWTPQAYVGASNLPWQQLGRFGPAGFDDAYGRLRLLPDPVRLGQSEKRAAVSSGAPDGVRASPMR
jgi:hypothetical protein